MRLIYLSNATVPSSTANSIQIMHMCAAFAARGHAVTLVAARGESGADAPSPCAHYGVPDSFSLAPLHPTPGPLRFGLFALRIAPQLWRNRTHWHLAYGRAPQSLYLAARFGIPSVYEVHMPPATRLRALLESHLLQLPALRRIVFISEALRQEYLARVPSCPALQHSVVAPSGAALPPATHAPPPSIPGRPKTPRAGYTGSLYPGKGAEIVLQLAHRCPDWDFYLIGGTPAAVATLAAGTPLPPNLHVIHFLPHARMLAFQRQMDVLLLPAQSSVLVLGRSQISPWMSPLKMLEYMAAGRPIVSSDLPVLREVLHDGVNALLVPPTGIDAWHQALEQLRHDRALAARLAAQALRELRDHYCWDKRAARVLAGLEPPASPLEPPRNP